MYRSLIAVNCSYWSSTRRKNSEGACRKSRLLHQTRHLLFRLCRGFQAYTAVRPPPPAVVAETKFDRLHKQSWKTVAAFPLCLSAAWKIFPKMWTKFYCDLQSFPRDGQKFMRIVFAFYLLSKIVFFSFITCERNSYLLLHPNIIQTFSVEVNWSHDPVHHKQKERKMTFQSSFCNIPRYRHIEVPLKAPRESAKTFYYIKEVFGSWGVSMISILSLYLWFCVILRVMEAEVIYISLIFNESITGCSEAILRGPHTTASYTRSGHMGIYSRVLTWKIWD